MIPPTKSNNYGPAPTENTRPTPPEPPASSRKEDSYQSYGRAYGGGQVTSESSSDVWSKYKKKHGE